jgi:hypothetical protein
MDITLSGILEVVGSLDDSPGEDTARERFRHFLEKNVQDVGQLRDYVNECLRIAGPQYNRALQDLVNLIGRFLGFEVTYGRYQGVSGQIGFDGYWKSQMRPNGFHVVVETKTTEVYAIKTTTLIGYVNDMISEKMIPSWEGALGLYVVGRPDPELKQLEHAIIAQNWSDKLRIISVESLLSLAEMMNQYDVSHEDMLAVIRPSGPTIDPIVDLMARLVVPPPGPLEKPLLKEVSEESQGTFEVESSYWLTPVRSDEEGTAEDTISTLVEKKHIYAFGEKTPGRRHIRPGDWICFYATGKGVVAHARINSVPRKELNPNVRHADRYPWIFDLDSEELYLNEPVIIDATLRASLDAFKDRDVNKNWAWYVQANNKITEHDFNILTRRNSSS